MESQTKTILTVVILVVLVLAGAMYYRSQKMINETTTPPIEEEEGVFCTMDAMECPDGSYVGRVAPDCQFAPCPGTVPTY